jgi:hypothetical protein
MIAHSHGPLSTVYYRCCNNSSWTKPRCHASTWWLHPGLILTNYGCEWRIPINFVQDILTMIAQARPGRSPCAVLPLAWQTRPGLKGCMLPWCRTGVVDPSWTCCIIACIVTSFRANSDSPQQRMGASSRMVHYLRSYSVHVLSSSSSCYQHIRAHHPPKRL